MEKLNVNLVTINANDRLGVSISSILSNCGLSALNSSKYAVFPGFCDVHVHFREPGFSYKETIVSGSRASARGGYTAVCTMPNLNPVPDSLENLQQQLQLIQDGACIHVYPYGAITVGEKGEVLADLAGMAGGKTGPAVIAVFRSEKVGGKAKVETAGRVDDAPCLMLVQKSLQVRRDDERGFRGP